MFLILDPTSLSEDPVGGSGSSTVLQLEQSNTKMSSITDLPPEILSVVFQFAAPVFGTSEIVKHYDLPTAHKLPKTCPHFVFAAVSSLWHQVVWSTPGLWRSLFLFVDSAHTTEQEFFEIYLRNSGDLLLDLKVCYSPTEPDQLLGDIIHKTAVRLRLLVLVNFTVNSLTPFSTLTFPHLRELALITNDPPWSWRLVVNDAPSLRSFAIRLMGMPTPPESLQLPFSSITSVNLGHIPPLFALRFLLECPNLTDFAFESGGYTDGDFQPVLEPLVLPQLRSFIWIGYGEPVLSNLLKRLHTPNLQMLSVNYGAVGQNSHVWPEFLKRLPNSLKTLHLHEFRTYPPGLFGFVLHQGIEELGLHLCYHRFTNHVLEVHPLLDDHDDHNHDEGVPRCFPALKTLFIVEHQIRADMRRRQIMALTRKRRSNLNHLPPLKLSLALRMDSGELVPVSLEEEDNNVKPKQSLQGFPRKIFLKGFGVR